MTNGGILCLKQDMTSLLIENTMQAVTLLKFLEQEVIRLKTEEKDGYNAVVIGACKKEKDGKVSYRYVKEFKVDSLEWYNVWEKVSMEQLNNIEKVTIKTTTKGKGFAWVVKRFGFAGWPASHGSKFHRHPWGIGNRKPRRVNKNHPLPGHMGNVSVTVKNVKILGTHKVSEDEIIVVKGSVPGARNSLIRMYM